MAPLTLVDARIVGPLLALLMYFPERFEKLVPRRLRFFLKSPLLLKTLITLIGIDIIRKTSNEASRYIANNRRNVVFRPNNELVLITGGSSGIGLLMAKEFAKRGVKVIILDLCEPKETIPTNVYYYKCNVTSIPEIAEVAAGIRRDHGDPTVLINNAGTAFLMPILGGTEKGVRDTFEVNTISHFWTVREFVPDMVKKNHGHIVTIASMASYVVHSMNVDYCCSKASALAFHEGLSSELRNILDAPNVRTTTINPAWIRTPLFEKAVGTKDWKAPVMEPEFVVDKIVHQVMTGQSGQIILPPTLIMKVMTTIRAWPLWLQLYVRNSIGKELKAVSDCLRANA